MKPILILITGHPGTGKTTLAHRLSKELELPMMCKDEVKEILFDRLGWSTKEWSQKLSLASYGIMDYVMENTLRTGAGLIIESNFIAKYDSERIRKLIKKFDVKTVQIVLRCDEAVRAERFQNRSISGDRHVGHHDLDRAQEHLEGERRTPLDINAPIVEIDTSDFEKIDYVKLLNQIREF